MNEYKYMASWIDEDVITSDITKLPKDAVWKYWDGSVKEGQDPPRRVIILTTGLMYRWKDFEKVRLKPRKKK